MHESEGRFLSLFGVTLKAITHQVFGLIRVIPQGSLRVHNKLVSKRNGENIIKHIYTYLEKPVVILRQTPCQFPEYNC